MGNVRFPSSPEAEPRAPTSAVTSSGSTCPGCGQAVDPLRAGHVAVLESGFRYFCDGDCKQTYLRSLGRPPEEDVATARPPDVYLANGTHGTHGTNGDVASHSRPKAPTPVPPSVKTVAAVATTTAETEPVTTPVRATLPSPPAPAAPRRVVGTTRSSYRTGAPRARCCGDGGGAIVPAVGLLGASAEVARVPLVLGAFVALAARLVLVRRDAADPHTLVVLAPTFGSVGAMCWSVAVHDSRAASIAVLAGLACAAAIAVETIVGRARMRVSAARERIEQALELRARVGARRGHGGDARHRSAARRAGARRGRRGGRRRCDGDRRRGARRPLAGCTGRGDQARGRPDRRRRARPFQPVAHHDDLVGARARLGEAPRVAPGARRRCGPHGAGPSPQRGARNAHCGGVRRNGGVRGECDARPDRGGDVRRGARVRCKGGRLARRDPPRAGASRSSVERYHLQGRSRLRARRLDERRRPERSRHGAPRRAGDRRHRAAGSEPMSNASCRSPQARRPRRRTPSRRPSCAPPAPAAWGPTTCATRRSTTGSA